MKLIRLTNILMWVMIVLGVTAALLAQHIAIFLAVTPAIATLYLINRIFKNYSPKR